MDFEIRSAGQKGLGVFAKRAFHTGEVVLAETPVLVILKGERAHSTSMKVSAARAALSLCTSGTSGSVTLDSVMANNAFAVQRPHVQQEMSHSLSCLFLTASRFNHACLSTCTHRFVRNQVIEIRASRTIQEGEELTIPYTSLLDVCDPRRAGKCSEHGFSCNCEACNDPGTMATWARLGQLQASFSTEDPSNCAVIQQMLRAQLGGFGLEQAMQSMSDLRVSPAVQGAYAEWAAEWFDLDASFKMDLRSRVSAAMWMERARDIIAPFFGEEDAETQRVDARVSELKKDEKTVRARAKVTQ